MKNTGFGDRRSFSDGSNNVNPSFPQPNGGSYMGRSTTPQLPTINQNPGGKLVRLELCRIIKQQLKTKRFFLGQYTFIDDK